MTHAPPSGETRIAFYKAAKFWLVFLLALVAAAALWRIWAEQDPGAPRNGAGACRQAPAGVSYMR